MREEVQESQGPRYLKLKFKYELDSKEGPSCYIIGSHISYQSYRYYMFLREYLNIQTYIVMFIDLNHFNSLLS